MVSSHSLCPSTEGCALLQNLEMIPEVFIFILISLEMEFKGFLSWHRG